MSPCEQFTQAIYVFWGTVGVGIKNEKNKNKVKTNVCQSSLSSYSAHTCFNWFGLLVSSDGFLNILKRSCTLKTHTHTHTFQSSAHSSGALILEADYKSRIHLVHSVLLYSVFPSKPFRVI